MVDKTADEKLVQTIVAGVVKDMISAAPVHYRAAKFHVGQLLYNGKTKEDGLITGVFADEGIIEYEVWVPKESNSWEAGYLSSRWLERLSKLSRNVLLGLPARKRVTAPAQ
jgi:hypothetical protein